MFTSGGRAGTKKASSVWPLTGVIENNLTQSAPFGKHGPDPAVIAPLTGRFGVIPCRSPNRICSKLPYRSRFPHHGFPWPATDGYIWSLMREHV